VTEKVGKFRTLIVASIHTPAPPKVDAVLSVIGLLPTPELRTAALLAPLRAEVTRRSGKGHSVISSVCPPYAAHRDERIFVAQHAFNAHQEARGWAMAGKSTEVDRLLGHADELAERSNRPCSPAPTDTACSIPDWCTGSKASPSVTKIDFAFLQAHQRTVASGSRSWTGGGSPVVPGLFLQVSGRTRKWFERSGWFP
jgi:hypothetical protein